MKKTLLTLLLGIIIGVSFIYLVFDYKNNHPVKEKNNKLFLNKEKYTSLYPSGDIKEDSLLIKFAEDSRYCWDTIKLINGEVLTGSFATNFGDGDYYLRKEDTLFIPKESVLYYK
ncbi:MULTISPECIES: hypothetical protein [Chryseobacterium]|uniref:Uncharacterized protein n=1 Tax=Chryseobacterium muglaense TaxID=2893752 RepID=A0ABR8M8T9_9FLAO|nr:MULTISPECIES: hypothetical protein [Chryseobacterium]MBD3906753.1 hypothetical protein [Chryseobacterium muglaense]